MPVGLLLKAIGDSNFSVRQAAIEALQRSNLASLSPVVQEVIHVLLAQEAGAVLGSLMQGFMAEVIGNMGYPSAELLDTLTELLSREYWEVRMKATKALGQTRHSIPDAAIRRLLELRHEPESLAVCISAEEALAAILSLETGIEDD